MSAAHNIQSEHDAPVDDSLPDYMLTDQEFRVIFDREAQAKLGISGAEFVRRWNAGDFPDWDPELADLVLMLPFLGE